MNNDKIRIKINGGYLVAERNADPNYDGVSVTFEADSGDIVDIVLVECKSETDKKNIDVYCYEDVYSDDFTKKYTLGTDEIKKAIGNELEN